ncbi:hypothetical protein [Nocardia brasiliensis]|uniref:hypothetical protein n=1 Tax=Nocardia brasiliensis TaxID=37326 RepID=UPI002456CD80|nr:hypothetical protein [Nocardia brasiliensis]
MSAPLVFLDTETTGLHAARRPWEIAMIRREPDGAERRMTIYIADVDASRAELSGLNIGRFHERHPQYRTRTVESDMYDPWEGSGLSPNERLLSEYEAARIVEVWTRGAHLVGAVPNFDTETLAAMMRRAGLCPAWHYHLIDVETLAIGWLYGLAAHGHSSLACMDAPIDCDVDSMPLTLPWKSDALSRACGVEPPSDEERHTAMGDAQWAMRLYDQITGGAR